jgi:thymidylate kinase
LIQLVYLSVLVFIRVYVPVWQGAIVVCDRFAHDTLVEVMTDIDDSKLVSKTAGKMFLSLKPSFAFVVRLDVSAQTAFYRKNDVPHVRFLGTRRENYNVVSKQLGLLTINAENPFEVVHQDIMHIIGRL